jgi:RHS repeat-associated protein
VANTQDRLVNYYHDAAGNRTSVVDNSTTTGYGTANNLNQYASGSLGLPYDSNGNLTGQTGWTYQYDSQNRLTSASGSVNMTFAYDGRNRCVKRTLSSVATYFYYDGWNLVEEHGASGIQARYIHGAVIDELLARITSATTVFYHHDALGSTTALTDNAGNVVERYSYDAYGAPTFRNAVGSTITTTAHGNRFLFTGREWVSEIALYDYRNRIYSATLGRFLQTDPIGFEARDVNLYRYVGNGVPSRTDPYGLATVYSYWECTATVSLTGYHGDTCRPCSTISATSGWYEDRGAAERAAEAARDGKPIPKGCSKGSVSQTICDERTGGPIA